MAKSSAEEVDVSRKLLLTPNGVRVSRFEQYSIFG